ncbi:MAG: DUF2442 domain-containing protein [Caldilineaceae bacterium]
MAHEFSNEELYDVIGFEIVGDYTLLIRFDDETERRINFEPTLMGPLFGPLRDLSLFNQVKLDTDIGTLVWPTGADIDPTVLHNWPEHVDAIVARRTRAFVPETEAHP